MTVPSSANSPKCREVFQESLAHFSAENVAYDWPTAIFLYGAEAFAARESLGKNLDPYYEALAEKIPTIHDPDKASVSLPASLRDSPGAKKIIAASRDFFSKEKRNSLGVFNHVGSTGILGTLYPSSVWADSLIMATLNQIRMASSDEEKQQALRDAKIILENLKSKVPGLYSHAFYPEQGWRFPTEFHWARGNLWIALFLSEASAMSADFLPLLEKQITAIKKYYVLGKGLRTLIDDPSSSIESSSTALFGYVLLKGRALGLPASPEIERDIASVIPGFVKDKKFTGVSGPTTAFPLPFYYRSLIPQGEYPYGTGAFLLWCSAVTTAEN